MNENIVGVGAIIESTNENGAVILVQTRMKDGDPYSGFFEFPGGKVEPYENIEKSIKREILEEVGIDLSNIIFTKKSNIQETANGDSSFAFLPDYCVQQLKNGKPWVVFIFKVRVPSGTKTQPQDEEVCDIKWITQKELLHLFIDNKEKIFPPYLGVIELYLKENGML